jgi:F-type H+-transporting ATPase subunit delta
LNSADIASRYARALYHLGSSKEERERQLNELKQIKNILDQTPEVMQFFIAPQIPLQQKEKVLESCFKNRIESGVLSFLALLLERRRFQYFPEIVEKYDLLVKAALGILEGKLVTAVPAEENLVAALKQKLEKIYNKELILNKEIDPELLGGGILHVGNQLIDFSVRGKLDRLKEDLLSLNPML